MDGPVLTQVRELLQNGGFESGDFAPGWTTRTDSSDAFAAVDSSDFGVPTNDGKYTASLRSVRKTMPTALAEPCSPIAAICSTSIKLRPNRAPAVTACAHYWCNII